MFIIGNVSSQTELRWFQARSDGLLPRPDCFSVSIWWYRFLMLAWALWLAASLIRWLRLAWPNVTRRRFFKKSPCRAERSGGSAAARDNGRHAVAGIWHATAACAVVVKNAKCGR